MGEIYDRVAQQVGDIALPAKPKSFLGEYNFPEDPTSLTIDEVGQWMFTLTAWNGYVLRELALAGLATADAKSVYENHLRRAMQQVAPGGRPKTQQALISEAFSLEEGLEEDKGRLDQAEAEAGVWERLHKIYEAQVAVLSREVSRRMGEEGSKRLPA